MRSTITMSTTGCLVEPAFGEIRATGPGDRSVEIEVDDLRVEVTVSEGQSGWPTLILTPVSCDLDGQAPGEYVLRPWTCPTCGSRDRGCDRDSCRSL